LATIYTIGHSTRSLDEFLDILRAQGIQALVDIRSFPMSRRLPHFNRESMERELPGAGIEYRWKKDIGGRRSKTRQDSPNTGLRVEAFRNYADYMLTDAFQRAVTELVELAETRRTAIMCAEAVYFRCHRMLVSDWLTAHGHSVLHIVDKKSPRPHRLTPEAQLIGGQLLYPGGLPFPG
jgi:uncharacterized protein (DUF488 family)